MPLLISSLRRRIKLSVILGTVDVAIVEPLRTAKPSAGCRPEREKVKERILREGDVDFSNVIDSSFKAKALYDGLKKVCHPDRFAGDGRLAAKATEIFGLLVRHKHDYAALRGLKERAECELGVKIEEE